MSSAHPAEELDYESAKTVKEEIRILEEQLAQAKARLKSQNTTDVVYRARYHHEENGPQQPPRISTTPSYNPTTHFHLLLADSALPLGSFAFSSGLESYLAHTRPTSSFTTFLPLSIASYASTTLPFLLAAHRDPTALAALDDALDAAVVCTVGKRASVAQGRALLGIWERSFATGDGNVVDSAARRSVESYAKLLRTPLSKLEKEGKEEEDDDDRGSSTGGLPPVAAHLAPLFGAIAQILGLSLAQTAYVFMLGHVKALVSAAVRANLLGPYAAQRVLASWETQEMIRLAIGREWETKPEDAGQAVPVMDLWVGRHEVLYSRIFNS
ncbi:hypothetical protein N0V93_006549 [Gnomoniopsis smithogilvyi]|uniref:Urease accessory protein UreF n=1 Tax=Gnomoniopsis smithogilvyi TaxID=1191159 RepID=A0A9W8YPW6_9PEZI|nr:hypothetical protein N0V93_006549 [Gnomoniopsis smithogilvyi]